MTNYITFTIPGIPATQGSKRAYIQTGRAVMVEDNKRHRAWRSDVRQAALEVWSPEKQGLLDGCITLSIVFRFSRPKHHYGTGRNAEKIKDSAPEYPLGRPDLTKLTRAVEDALTGVVWTDDSRICQQVILKRYGPPLVTAVTILHDGVKVDGRIRSTAEASG